MKKIAFLMLGLCSTVWAESQVLPPVIDYSSYPKGGGNSTIPSNNAVYETLGRLEQMQAELQELRGLVEEQSQTIRDLKQRQGHIYTDLDQRIAALSSLKPKDPMTNPLVTSAAKGKSSHPGKSTSDNPPDPSKIALDKQQHVYQAAYETLRNGHITQAITAFKEFLVKYPNSDYADNAQYWLGEAYKVNRDLISARKAFTQVVNQYKGSPKVPDALLKLGYIALEKHNKVKARDYFKQITVNHPGTTASHLATKKLIQMGVIHP